jgi:hypothetical protein
MSSNTPGPWGRSRALSGRVNYEGLIPVVVVVPLCACLAVGLLAFLALLVLLLGLLGFAALRGRVVHALALLAVEDGPHHLFSISETGGESNSSLESTGGLRPSSRIRSRQVVPSRKACMISD